MIYLILGGNTYEAEQALTRIINDSALASERFDASALTDNTLADIVRGGSLFSEHRLVVLRQLSENKPAFEKLSDWAGEVPDDTTIVLLETKPDKRTKAYKAIAKVAKLITAEPWTDRQLDVAITWTGRRAKELGVTLPSAQAKQIATRAMQPADRPGSFVIDQQLINNALQSLSLVDGAITDDAIMAVLPDSAADSVFELLGTALAGDSGHTKMLLNSLHASTDPYMVFGFIASQWSQLVALKLSGQSPDVLAGAIGSSPYILRKLSKHAGALSGARVKELTELLASLDIKLKTTGMEPWVAVDRFIGELNK